MKKIMVVFFLMGTFIFGSEKLGNDISKNQTIIDNLKLENQKLADEVKRLKTILSGLDTNLEKTITFEERGIELIRTKGTFTVRLKTDDLKSSSTSEFLANISEISKYKDTKSIEFIGTKENIEYLKTYFLSNGVDEKKIILTETENLEESEKTIPETTIILSK